jgi:predicted Rossmann-fold nucleotide-binding protein
MDELFESLTLIQTRRIRSFPAFLMGSAYWGGLIDWMKGCMLEKKYISPEDLDNFRVLDDPEEVVKSIRRTLVL